MSEVYSKETTTRLLLHISSLRQICKQYAQFDFAAPNGEQLAITAQDFESILYYALCYLDKTDTHHRSVRLCLTQLLEGAERSKTNCTDPAIAIDEILDAIRTEKDNLSNYIVGSIRIYNTKDYGRDIAGTRITNVRIDSVCSELSELRSKEKSSRKSSKLYNAETLIKRMQQELNKLSEKVKEKKA